MCHFNFPTVILYITIKPYSTKTILSSMLTLFNWIDKAKNGCFDQYLVLCGVFLTAIDIVHLYLGLMFLSYSSRCNNLHTCGIHSLRMDFKKTWFDFIICFEFVILYIRICLIICFKEANIVRFLCFFKNFPDTAQFENYASW